LCFIVVCCKAFTPSSPVIRKNGSYRTTSHVAATAVDKEGTPSPPKATLLDKAVNGFQVWALCGARAMSSPGCCFLQSALWNQTGQTLMNTTNENAQCWDRTIAVRARLCLANLPNSKSLCWNLKQGQIVLEQVI